MFTHTHSHSRSDSNYSHDAHTRGAVDPLILSTDRGIWALKWSLLGSGGKNLAQARFLYMDAILAYLQAMAELEARLAFSCPPIERI